MPVNLAAVRAALAVQAQQVIFLRGQIIWRYAARREQLEILAGHPHHWHALLDEWDELCAEMSNLIYLLYAEALMAMILATAVTVVLFVESLLQALVEARK